MFKGLTSKITKRPKAASHSSRPVTSGKSPNAAMSKATASKPSLKAINKMAGVRTSGKSPNTQMSSSSTTKQPQKVVRRRVTGNTKVFGD